MQLIEELTVPNTFDLKAYAATGCVARSRQQLLEAYRYCAQHNLVLRVLGEGSNVICHEQIDAFICLVRTSGVTVLTIDDRYVEVSVEAGENWHQFVMHCVQQGWFGLENLALIPGLVGAAPIQNIGAYGVEIAQFISRVGVIDEQGRQRELTAAACEFSYRDSLFKRQPGYVITHVVLKLSVIPSVELGYQGLAERFEGRSSPTPMEIAQAVIDIRQQKLPDPSQVPNAGSFFKNPVVSAEFAARLTQRWPALHQYAQSSGVKLSAAQLIDLAGGKTLRDGPVTCWQRQPLVLVNAQRLATSTDVLAFAQQLQALVYQQFEVQLELEPSFVS